MSELSQFVLVLQDADGKIEIAGVQRPEQFDGSLISHVVGRWLADNINQVVRFAMEEHRRSSEEPVVIDGDRERTILLPPGAADAA